jgi:hypothetical protein
MPSVLIPATMTAMTRPTPNARLRAAFDATPACHDALSRSLSLDPTW